jgi:tryptophan synthase alpha chain
MSRIDVAFAAAKADNRAAFIPFITAGDPDYDASLAILKALPAAGADIIELGIPFSDPMADGPVIEAAGLRALEAGMTLKKVLEMVRAFRADNSTTPIVLMGYLNPVYVYGYEAFARDAAAAGVDGIILVDAPPEEAGEIEPTLTAHGISFVRLIAPTSLANRLPLLTKGAGGYLYYVSVTGITGSAMAQSNKVGDALAQIRAATDLPVCVGFGIKTPQDVASFAPLADGVVVGSAIVRKIEETKADVAAVSAFVRSLAEGCRKA